MAEYERHHPEQSLLHRVIGEQLESFLANARERCEPVAHFVERELRAYLECGVLAHGFMRVHCDACGHDRLVAFSCKGRGFCPSCGGRRMADTAAHLVDRILPEVPVRQWVLTLPYPLRYRCAWDARLTSEVLRAFLRALFADQRRRARQHHGVRGGRCASVTFIQRFGSALNLTPHFHSLVLDGIYPGPAFNPGPFLPLPPPETEDVARVMAGTARRVVRLLEKRGLAASDDPLAGEDPLLATLMAASIRSRIATGQQAGEPWRRLGDRVEPVEPGQGDNESLASPPPRCVREGGMSLHADVCVPARDRRRLERLCRYVARPPLALDRLEAMQNGLLSYRLKTPWRDGTTHVLMERRELLERLAPLIPPPRSHQVRYHGLLAPCASGRNKVVHGASREEGGPAAEKPAMRVAAKSNAGCASAASLAEPKATDAPPPPRRSANVRRLLWAELLKRVFELHVLRCPNCGGKMRVLAAITQPDIARRILKHLALPARAPPIAAALVSVEPVFEPIASGMPEGEGLDEGVEEGPAVFDELDQSPPGDWHDGV